MFWKETPRLRSLSLANKLIVSAFLVLAGIGYVFGFFNIVLTYQMTDGTKGLSVKDVQLVYYGDRGSTALEGSIDGSMRDYFSSDSNYNVVKDWLALGADEGAYGPVQSVFDTDCFACHNADYAAADVSVETFADLEPLLKTDTGKSINRLVSLSHSHILATIVVVFLLVFIMSFSSYPAWVKSLLGIAGFLAVFMDIGSWWLAKLSPGLAILVILGGALLGTTFGAFTLLGLFDVWFGKKE